MRSIHAIVCRHSLFHCCIVFQCMLKSALKKTKQFSPKITGFEEYSDLQPPPHSPLWIWSLGPSRMGPPFLLSEPNRNYPSAADPRVGLWVGERSFLGLLDLETFPLNPGGPGPAPAPAPPPRLPGARAPPHPPRCLALVFFSSRNPGAGVMGMRPVKGVARERRGQALRNPLFLQQ